MKWSRLRVELLVLLALLGMPGTSGAADPPPTAAPPVAGEDPSTTRFAKEVVPFLSKHCYACHGNGKRKANLALDAFKDESGRLLLSRTAVSELGERLWADYQEFVSRNTTSPICM